MVAPRSSTMTPHKRVARARDRIGDDRIMVVALKFLSDLQHWVLTDPRVTLRILRMMVEINRDPLGGIGKPEPLKHSLSGLWSRWITDEDRLLYRLQGDRVEFTEARGHYR